MIKVIIEKSRGGRFFMEQELRFGLDLGRLAILKKKGLGRLWATFDGGFFMFSEAKKVGFFSKHRSVRTKKLHKMKLKKYFWFLKKINKYIFFFL